MKLQWEDEILKRCILINKEWNIWWSAVIGKESKTHLLVNLGFRRNDVVEPCGDPALYPHRGTGGCMGVCLTSLLVYCGIGKGIWPCPLVCPVGGWGDASGVWGTGPTATGHLGLGAWMWFTLAAMSQTCSQWVLVSTRAALCHRFCS